MESKFNKDLVLSLSMVIPCVHIPRNFIAEKAINYFVTYLEKANNEGKSIEQVILDINSTEQNNG
jgi:hypothetical protein